MPIKIQEFNLGVSVIEVSMNNNVYVGVSAVSRVVVSPVFMYYYISFFHSKLSETFLGFSIIDIQIYINLPNLRIHVSFFDKKQLFMQFLPFMRGIFTFRVNSSYYYFLLSLVTLFQKYLGADHFIIVKDFSCFLSVNIFFLEDNCAFSIVLILIVLDYIVDFIF